MSTLTPARVHVELHGKRQQENGRVGQPLLAALLRCELHGFVADPLVNGREFAREGLEHDDRFNQLTHFCFRELITHSIK